MTRTFIAVSSATASAPEFADQKVDRYYGNTQQAITTNSTVTVDGKRFAYGINVDIAVPLEGKVTLSSTSPAFSYTVSSTGTAVTESNVFSLAGTDPESASKSTTVTMTLYDASDAVVSTQTKTLTIARNHSKTLKVKALDPKASFSFTTSDDEMTNDGDVVVSGDNDDSNLLPGKFSVSATKQVRFTKSNLYWDGSAFKFEENQTDYQTSWNASHVGLFFWTSFTDYQSGTAAYMPYAESYSYSSQSTSDKFWCGEDNPLTVEGTSGLYALTGGSRGEWYYLINSRTNASSLYKYGVTVGSVANCLIIAPDDYSETLKSSYTLDEVNSLGLVCLPAAGSRDGSSVFGGSSGNYWSATPYSSNSNVAYYLYFYSSNLNPASYCSRNDGYSLRLVRGI